MTSTIHIRRLHGCLILTLTLAVTLMTSACGGSGGSSGSSGGGDGSSAESPRVVVLAGERFDSIEALADAAASERGAPGEGEAVLYRLRERAGTPATAQAEQLRALGFRHVEAE